MSCSHSAIMIGDRNNPDLVGLAVIFPQCSYRHRPIRAFFRQILNLPSLPQVTILVDRRMVQVEGASMFSHTAAVTWFDAQSGK